MSNQTSHLALERQDERRGDTAGPAAPVDLVAFDYTGVDAANVADLRASASRVRALAERMTINYISIGLELISAKEKLGHGQFGAWLQAEFRWADRTARRFMRAAEVFGAKTDTVSVLEPTAVYLLSAPSTPDRARQEVIDRLERGEAVSTADVKSTISSMKRPPGEGTRRPVRRSTASPAPNIMPPAQAAPAVAQPGQGDAALGGRFERAYAAMRAAFCEMANAQFPQLSPKQCDERVPEIDLWLDLLEIIRQRFQHFGAVSDSEPTSSDGTRRDADGAERAEPQGATEPSSLDLSDGGGPELPDFLRRESTGANAQTGDAG